MTRRAAAAAAAQAAAAAGGVQRPGIAGGGSVSLRAGGEISSAESDVATFFRPPPALFRYVSCSG